MITGARAKKLWAQGIEAEDGSVMKTLPIDVLRVDHTYQRPPVIATVRRIATNFDRASVGIVTVGQRKNGKYYIIDGQNRVEAIKKRLAELEDSLDHVMCRVYLNTTAKFEARKFVELNTNKPVTGNNRMHARLSFKGQPEWWINEAVKSKGFELSFLPPNKINHSDNPANGIIAPYQLLRLYNDCPNCLIPALEFLRAIYAGKPKNVPPLLRHGYVIYAIALFLEEQGCKDVQPIVETFLSRGFDLASRWRRIQRGSSKLYGHDKSQRLADWLGECCSNAGDLALAA